MLVPRERRKLGEYVLQMLVARGTQVHGRDPVVGRARKSTTEVMLATETMQSQPRGPPTRVFVQSSPAG